MIGLIHPSELMNSRMFSIDLPKMVKSLEHMMGQKRRMGA